MGEDTTSSVKMVAGAAAVTLCVALAAVIGIVPGADDAGEPQNVVATAVTSDPAPPAVQAAELPAPPVVTVPPPAPPPPPTTAAPKAAAPRAVTKVSAPKAAPVAAPAPTPPPGPVVVARRQPSSAEVNAAIQGLRPYVSYTPTQAQVAQGADQICTAFDQGQTYDQVKATALSKVPSFVTVRPGAAEYVILKAVELYCPGHASKLG